MNLRSRRMDAEWELLERLATANPHVLTHTERHKEEFRVELKESPAWMSADGKRWIEREHLIRYVFPRYYPSLLLEAYMMRPIEHPNVDPANGFICLWKNHRTTQTIVDAVVTTRAVLSWSAVNDDPEHCMQSVQGLAMLTKSKLTIPDDCRLVALGNSSKQRLEVCAMDCVLPER